MKHKLISLMLVLTFSLAQTGGAVPAETGNNAALHQGDETVTHPGGVQRFLRPQAVEERTKSRAKRTDAPVGERRPRAAREKGTGPSSKMGTHPDSNLKTSQENQEKYEELGNFILNRTIKYGMVQDGSMYTPTPYSVLPSIFDKLYEIFGDLKGRHLLDFGAGDLRVSLFATYLYYMITTAVEKDKIISLKAKKILKEAQDQSFAKEDGLCFLPETDALDISWQDFDIVYFFYTEPSDNEQARLFRERLQDKAKEMKSGSLLAMLFTRGQLDIGRDKFPSLDTMRPEPLRISGLLKVFYLQIYSINRNIDRASRSSGSSGTFSKPNLDMSPKPNSNLSLQSILRPQAAGEKLENVQSQDSASNPITFNPDSPEFSRDAKIRDAVNNIRRQWSKNVAQNPRKPTKVILCGDTRIGKTTFMTKVFSTAIYSAFGKELNQRGNKIIIFRADDWIRPTKEERNAGQASGQTYWEAGRLFGFIQNLGRGVLFKPLFDSNAALRRRMTKEDFLRRNVDMNKVETSLDGYKAVLDTELTQEFRNRGIIDDAHSIYIDITNIDDKETAYLDILEKVEPSGDIYIFEGAVTMYNSKAAADCDESILITADDNTQTENCMLINFRGEQYDRNKMSIWDILQRMREVSRNIMGLIPQPPSARIVIDNSRIFHSYKFIQGMACFKKDALIYNIKKGAVPEEIAQILIGILDDIINGDKTAVDRILKISIVGENISGHAHLLFNGMMAELARKELGKRDRVVNDIYSLEQEIAMALSFPELRLVKFSSKGKQSEEFPYVAKPWGAECRVWQDAQFGVKVISVAPCEGISIQHHNKKREVKLVLRPEYYFYCSLPEYGQIKGMPSWKEALKALQRREVREGLHVVDIEEGVVHTETALEEEGPTVLIELYSPPLADETVRLIDRYTAQERETARRTNIDLLGKRLPPLDSETITRDVLRKDGTVSMGEGIDVKEGVAQIARSDNLEARLFVIKPGEKRDFTNSGDSSQFFIVLNGGAPLTKGGNDFYIETGDAFELESGSAIEVRPTGRQEIKILTVSSPSKAQPTQGQDFFERYADRVRMSTEDKRRLLNYVKGEAVIELGCAAGNVVSIVKEKNPKLRVVGIDISPELIHRGTRAYPGIEFHARDIVNWSDFSDFTGQFDTVIISSSLHEIEAQYGEQGVRDTFLKAYRLLRHNGRIIFRDGVKPDEGMVTFKFKTFYARDKFYKFVKDFRVRKILYTQAGEQADPAITMSKYDFHDLLCKYYYEGDIWEHDMKESFGLHTEEGYKAIISPLFSIRHIECYQAPYLLSGWREHFKVLNKDDFPNSHILLIGDKRELGAESSPERATSHIELEETILSSILRPQAAGEKDRI